MTTETAVEPHVHYWILPEPNGHESPGRCRDCGASKMHFNSQRLPAVVLRKPRRLHTSSRQVCYHCGHEVTDAVKIDLRDKYLGRLIEATWTHYGPACGVCRQRKFWGRFRRCAC